MATHQATEAAKAGRLGNDGNAVCRHFFPARMGRVVADDRLFRGFCQGVQPWRQAANRRIASPRRDAGAMGLRNPG